MSESDHWRHCHDVWTVPPDPPDVYEILRGLPDWAADYELVNQGDADPWWTLWLVDAGGAPLCQVEHSREQWETRSLATGEDLDPDTERLLQAARSRYTISISETLFEAVHGVQLSMALGLAILTRHDGLLHDESAQRTFGADDLRSILESDDFAIEHHVTLHLVTDEVSHQAWLHSHGMEKFGCSNLETFDLPVALGRDAGKLLNDLMLSAALGTRDLLGEQIVLPSGSAILRPSHDLRAGVLTVPHHEFEGHEGPHLCLVNSADYGTIAELVDGYLHRSIAGMANFVNEEEVTRKMLPLLHNHFVENNSSEDFEYFARIPMDVERGSAVTRESMWVKITRWRDSALRGTLASDSVLDSRLQVGVEVDFVTDDIEAILLSAFGKPVGGESLMSFLKS